MRAPLVRRPRLPHHVTFDRPPDRWTVDDQNLVVEHTALRRLMRQRAAGFARDLGLSDEALETLAHELLRDFAAKGGA